jgi:hypothetical protein
MQTQKSCVSAHFLKANHLPWHSFFYSENKVKNESTGKLLVVVVVVVVLVVVKHCLLVI